MREEHPDQLELGGLPPVGPATVVDVAQGITDLAKVSSEVLEKGLVRESRPVFVYDKKEAEARSGNAKRQERHREKIKASGLITARVPAAVVEHVKTSGGDWSALLKLAASAAAPLPVEVRVPFEVRVEIPAALSDDQKALLVVGAQVRSLRGWKARLAAFLLS